MGGFPDLSKVSVTLRFESVFSPQNLAESLNPHSLSGLVQSYAAIASLRQRIEQDPLGVSVEVEQQIKAMLAKVKSVVEQALKQQH